MRLFKRKREAVRPTSHPDPEFSFLSLDEGVRLRALVRQVFAEHGLEVTVHDGHVADSAGRTFGLHNVAAKCHPELTSERGWHRIVTEHVATVLRAMSDGSGIDSLSREEVLSRVYVRVVGRCTLPSMDGLSYARQLSDHVVEVLALDCPEAVATLGDEDVNRFGLGDLRAAGVENLLSEPYDEHEAFDVGGALVHLVAGNSLYTGSKLLVLRDLIRRTVGDVECPHGVVVAVPNRHFVLFHIIETGAVVAAINAIARFAVDAFGEGVSPISPEVYWWRGGRIEPLSYVDADGASHIIASPGFLRMMNEVVREP